MRRGLAALLFAPALAWGATQKYVDPSCTFNGNGNGTDCAASAGAVGAYNTLPTPVDNTTYSFKRGTTYSADGLNINVGGSSSTSRVTLNAYGTGAKPIIAPTNGGRSGNSILIGTDKAHITIDGLDIRGPTNAGNIQTNGVRNATTGSVGTIVTDIIVQNCNVQDILDSHLATDDEDGIDLFGAQNQILNNTIENIANDGVWVNGEDDVISGNFCRTVSQGGTSGDCYQVNIAGARVTVTGNYCDHTDKDTKQCIVTNAPDNVITGNKNYCYVGGSTNTCILCDGPRCKIGPGNYTNGGSAGISAGATWGGTNHLIEGNVLENSQSYSIDVNADNTIVDNNTVIRGSAMANNALSGIILRQRPGLKARNNLLVGFGRGLSLYSANAPVEANNGYYSNTTNVYDLTTSAAKATTNAITADPLLPYVGGHGLAYRPIASSPLLGAGAVVASYTDHRGCPFREVPSIGAFEVAACEVTRTAATARQSATARRSASARRARSAP